MRGLQVVTGGESTQMHFQAATPNQGYCKARLWGDGLLTQCTAKTGDSDFCKRHSNSLSHGRIDVDAPAEVVAKARKHLSKRSQPKVADSQNSELSETKKAKRSDTSAQTGEKLDDALLFVVRAWVAEGCFSEEDMREAR